MCVQGIAVFFSHHALVTSLLWGHVFPFTFIIDRGLSSNKASSLTLSLRMATARVSPPYLSTLACGTPRRRSDFGVLGRGGGGGGG